MRRSAASDQASPSVQARMSTRASGGRRGGSSISWYFATDVSDAPKGAIAVRLTPSTSASPSPASTPTAPAPPASTSERRAQATVWDHVRSERLSFADPALEAEAKRLMEAATGGDRRRKKLCFARDSIIAETFEYQSERSLMEELKITPDYPTEQFEPPVSPVGRRKTEAGAPAAAAPDGAPPRTEAPDIGSYQAKLANEAFVWGSRLARPEPHRQPRGASAEDAVNSSVNGGGRAEHRQHQHQQQQQQQQWSVSTTADLLF